MLEALIRGSLRHRLVVLLLAALLMALGGRAFLERPVDIFPDLNQPTVTILADAHGLAPEEVETLVTLPLEAALGGAPGVTRLRTTSGDGISIVRVDFEWDTDLYRDRQVVQERLQMARADLPEGVVPEMAPIASITGEVVDIGLYSPDGSASELELHTLAEWMVRRRLLSVQGVSQVVIIGGREKQYQVLGDSDLLLRHGVTMEQVGRAVSRASHNTSGGYFVQGNDELLVRNLGRLRTVEEIADVVVAPRESRPVRVRDVARVVEGPAYPRGAASVEGHPGVMLLVFKQPDVNTLVLTRRVDEEVERIRGALPEGVEIRDDLYRQATFLQTGVDNVIEALSHGAALVVIVLLAFLASWRASLVSLLALPLSFAAAALAFTAFDLTLDTMTLGGLAIAVGELVDDAIVGVENVVRRLRGVGERAPDLEEQVARASSEVRGPIFTGTLMVVLVFLPLLALSGIEGRLFAPMAIAYITSILASMVVSLTVTPALALFLFRDPGLRSAMRARPLPRALAGLRLGAERTIRASLRYRRGVVGVAAAAVAAAVLTVPHLGTDFLPDFDEGTVLVLSFLPPGTSVHESDRYARALEERLAGIEGVRTLARYTGRGEHDEHAPPPSVSHLILGLDPDGEVPHEQVMEEVRGIFAENAGASVNVGQPLAHRIDHILSGMQAQVAIKVMGTDLAVLRSVARRVRREAGTVEGVTDLYMEPQVLVPQVQISPRRIRLSEVGLTPGGLAHKLGIAVGGEVVGQILEGERTFDLFVRLRESDRNSLEALRRLPVKLPTGESVRLGTLAAVELVAGPNAISRDDMLRRVAVTCNAEGRSLGEVVRDLRSTLAPLEAELPEGTFLRFEGQFESQLSATRTIGLLSLLSLAAMSALLWMQLRSWNLTAQVLGCVPAAFVGGILLLLATGQTFNVAALVGFISLGGIASRNGILLVTHYLHLLRHEGVPFGPELMVRAGRERAAPVVMTALTTGMGLLPLLLSAGETGREILYPVATVVIGGLLTSTLFEFTLRPALFHLLGRGASNRGRVRP